MRGRAIGFWTGFSAISLFWISMNVRSYWVSKAVFDERQIRFSHEGFRYGFPFASFWEGTCFPCDWVPFLNLSALFINFVPGLIAALCAGMCLRLLYSRLRGAVEMK